MSAISVRALEAGEWSRYRAVRLAALAESPQAFGSTLGREEAFTEETWRGRLVRRNQFIAEGPGGTGEAYGLIGVVPVGPDTAELVSLWVRPGARGRGVGDALVTAALDWAREHGFRETRLLVTEGNHHAEQLYARHGFRRTGEAEGTPGGGEDGGEEFAMARPSGVTAWLG